MDVNPLVGCVVEGRYRIECELGAGAMGAVYRGRHIKVGRPVAIKVLHDHLVGDAMMVARFEREAQIAARLEHPNLVAVLDLGFTDAGQRCMVLELAPGRALASYVSRPQSPARVLDLTRQLLRGLEHAHDAGLIHRDLKPENVLVEEHADGTLTARIVDFGIAVLRDTSDTSDPDARRITSAGVVLGTPMYMAPEQALGQPLDPRVDLFALGVIVYELLAGIPPFDGSGVEIMMSNMMQEPPSIATRARIDVDPLLEAFARTLMARERDARFASAADALSVLELIERDRDAAARALGLGECAPRRECAGDAIVTRRHVVSIAMQPLTLAPATVSAAVARCATDVATAPTAIATVPPLPSKVEVAASPVPSVTTLSPPRRRRWGAHVGAAVIIAIALGIVVLLADAARAHARLRDQSSIQRVIGCARGDDGFAREAR